MLKSKANWKIKNFNEEKARELQQMLTLDPIVAKLLVQRGIQDVDKANIFLHTELQDFYDPFLLDEMDKVVARISKAIDEQEKVLVYGDYDADGVTSTTVMLKALKKLGANVDFYIPNRFTEGYGPNEQAFVWAKETGYSLIITVDTGISAVHEADVALEHGIDLIITDHHELPPTLPNAFAIIHPRKEGSKYPFGELAGVGVSLKVAQALLGGDAEELLAFAAIGTIADLVPLHSENRLIVSRGLVEIQHSTNKGIRELIKICGLEEKPINEESIGFAIGPRVNAAGRLYKADPAVHLFLTDEETKAQELANEIDQINRERQALVSELTKEAIEEVEQYFPPDQNRVLVIAREGWNPGVIGIVASRLVEKYYRPTIVLSIDREKQEAKGSARSIAGFNLYDNLSTCRDILPHFGGHAMAAGMTLKLDDLDQLRNRLNDIAFSCLHEDDLVPTVEVDISCSLDEITIESIEKMAELAPCGVGNPKPRIIVEDVTYKQMRKIGNDNSHLKITLESDGLELDSVGFGFGDVVDEIAPLSKLAIVGELSINEWNGHRKPQLMVQDIAVNHWQLFDLRGVNTIEKYIPFVDMEQHVFVAFHKNTLDRLKLKHIESKIVVFEDVQIQLPVNIQSLYLLDLPNDKKDLEYIVKTIKPTRIYAIFHHDEDHFFQTIPTREHFKWFYGFLLKNKSFHLQKHAHVISKQRGWSAETIQFMTKVFYELDFVKMEDGNVMLIHQPKKRDISESETYIEKNKLIEIQQELLYSPYVELKQLLDPYMQDKVNEEKLEEVIT